MFSNFLPLELLRLVDILVTFYYTATETKLETTGRCYHVGFVAQHKCFDNFMLHSNKKKTEQLFIALKCYHEEFIICHIQHFSLRNTSVKNFS